MTEEIGTDRTRNVQHPCDPSLIAALTELTRDACLVMSSDAVICAANVEAERLYGYEPDELVGMDMAQLCTGESASTLADELPQVSGGGLLFTSVHVRKDGFAFPVEVGWKHGRVGAHELLVAHVRDISERLQLETDLKLKSKAFDASLDAIIVHDLDGNLVLANLAAADAAGLSYDDFMRLGPWGWIAGDARGSIHERLAVLRQRGAHIFESSDTRADGSSYHAEVHARLVEVEDRTLVVSVVRDVSERMRAMEAIRRMAYSDPLTGLANRAQLMTALERAIQDARRHGDVLGVIFLDLDDFKPVNDRFGHAAGDQLLVDLARRFSDALRSTDTVGRMGGDEFAVVLPRLANSDTALEEAINKLARCVATPTRVAGEMVTVTASIGAAVFDQATDDADTLLAKADSAMYSAKNRGVQWEVWSGEC